MGQSVSKAVEKGGSTAVAAAKKTRGAVADPITGFTRGQGPMIRQDAQQQAFLEHQQRDSKSRQEMPDDLLRFLNDVGPLREKSQTPKNAKNSSDNKSRPLRLPRHLLPPEEQQSFSPKSAAAAIDKTRLHQPMPLADNIEGYDTMRTTSFSRREDVYDPKDFGLDILDFFRLLDSGNSGKEFSSQVFFRDQCSRMASHAGSAEETAARAWASDEEEKYAKLLEQSRNVIQLPVLLKDTDDTYVGAWPHRVDNLKFLKLTEVSKEQVKLVLEDLIEMESSDLNDEKRVTGSN